METPDQYTKILLATQSITYMSYALASTDKQIKWAMSVMPASGYTHSPQVEQALEEALKKLVDTMELLGECMNITDMIDDVDVLATTAAFDIVSGRKGSI